MLEMLKARRESLQERGVKGFTLMEMLIVIAIIAVLIAIAIPVLGAQLARANAATDQANIRDGYASYQVAQLQDSNWDKDVKYWLATDGSVVKGTAAATAPTGDALGGKTLYECKGASENADGADTSSHEVDIAGISVSWEEGDNIIYSYDSSSKSVEINHS